MKSEKIFLRFKFIPKEPIQFVILAPSIIISFSRMSIFVAHQHHRSSKREHQSQMVIAHLPLPQFYNFWIVGRAFGSAIPAGIIIVPIPIFFPVIEVVLVLVAHEISQRISIMCGDKVDAIRRIPVAAVQVVRSAETSCKIFSLPISAFDKAADCIPIFPIPFGPFPWKTADLVQSGCIPRFGDQLSASEYRIFCNRLNERRIFQRLSIPVSCQNRGQVESKSIDMHFTYPIMERI